MNDTDKFNKDKLLQNEEESSSDDGRWSQNKFYFKSKGNILHGSNWNLVGLIIPILWHSRKWINAGKKQTMKKLCVTNCWRSKEATTLQLDTSYVNGLYEAVNGALHRPLQKRLSGVQKETHKDNIVLADKRKTGLYFCFFIQAFEWKRGRVKAAVQCLVCNYRDTNNL